MIQPNDKPYAPHPDGRCERCDSIQCVCPIQADERPSPAPEPPIREARVCMKCGRTEARWRYNRCPNCGEMADEQPKPSPVSATELRAMSMRVFLGNATAEDARALRELAIHLEGKTHQTQAHAGRLTQQEIDQRTRND